MRLLVEAPKLGALVLFWVMSCDSGSSFESDGPGSGGHSGAGGSGNGGDPTEGKGGASESGGTSGKGTGGTGTGGSGTGGKGTGGSATGGSGGDPPCDLDAPFGTPDLLPIINGTTSDANATLSADELTIYFVSDRDGLSDIFTATRADRNDHFDAPEPLDALNSPSHDRFPSVTADGLEAYFLSDRNGANRIYVATRSTRTAVFSDPALVANVAGPTSEWAPFITADGSNLYFDTYQDGIDDIHRATKTSGAFGEPAPVIELNTGPYQEVQAVLSPDELSVYFSSTRPNGGAKGLLDIWYATRSSKSDEFSGLVNVAELNSELDEQASWLSADGCRLYFDIYDGSLWHIYLAQKP